MEARIAELEPQPTAAVRVRRPMEGLDLGALFARWIPVVAGRLGEAGVQPVGPPYGRYWLFGPDEADVEIGFPVRSASGLPALAGCPAGEVGESELPGGEVATTVHVGPYDCLGPVFLQLQGWIVERGSVPGAGQWESYVDDPGAVDAASLRTELYWPIGE